MLLAAKCWAKPYKTLRQYCRTTHHDTMLHASQYWQDVWMQGRSGICDHKQFRCVLHTSSFGAASVCAPRCWSFPAAALSHSGPVWLQLFRANGNKWKHRAMVLISSFKIHWALHGKLPATWTEQQNTKELEK